MKRRRRASDWAGERDGTSVSRSSALTRLERCCSTAEGICRLQSML